MARRRTKLGRRAVFPVLAGALLGGCGFKPMYARTQGGATGPAAQGLAQTNVVNIPERSGQMLRQDLQERFERSGVSEARRYDLSVKFGLQLEGIAVTPDTVATRLRVIGQATFQLVAQDSTRTTLYAGTARSVDGLNPFNQQMFATDLEFETVQRRIAADLADQITQQLATYFDRRAASAGSSG
jgi:LPS-assembly lipoprotein